MRTDKNYKNSPEIQNQMMKLELEKQRYAASRGTPKFGDRSGDGFQKMADRTQDKDLYGRAMFQGLADGFKVSADQERKKDDDRYMRVLDFMTKSNQQLQESIDQGRQQQEQDKNLADDITASIARLENENGQTFQEMGTESQNNLLQSIFSRHSQRTGLGDKYIGLTWKEGKPKVIYENSDGVTKIKDPEEIGYKYNPNLATYQLNQQKANTQEKSVNNQIKKNSLEHIMAQKGGTEFIKQAVEEKPKLEAAINNDKEVIRGMKTLTQLYEEEPEIFTSPMLIDALSAKDQSVWQNFVKSNPFRDTKLADKASFALKLLNDLHTKRIDKVGNDGVRVTIPIVETIVKSLANPSQTQGGALMALRHELEGFEDNLAFKEKQLSGYQGVYNELAQNPVLSAFMTSNSSQSNNSGQQPQDSVNSPATNTSQAIVVRVRDPNTGEEMSLSPEDAKIAIDRGGVEI